MTESINLGIYPKIVGRNFSARYLHGSMPWRATGIFQDTTYPRPFSIFSIGVIFAQTLRTKSQKFFANTYRAPWRATAPSQNGRFMHLRILDQTTWPGRRFSISWQRCFALWTMTLRQPSWKMLTVAFRSSERRQNARAACWWAASCLITR